jgi:hypothetical protein
VWRTGKILGIALGPAGALVAEVSNGSQVSQLAEFVYPAGVGIDKPQQLGAALSAFLRKEKIGARDAVIGLPAKWLMTRAKSLPPASAAVAAAGLRLSAEAEFSNEKDLVIDFAGEPRTGAVSNVLLVATAQTTISRCQELAKAAGIKLYGITATGAAMATVIGRTARMPGILVSISAAGNELVVQHDGSPTRLRHLTVEESPDMAANLAGEIRRAIIGVPQNGSPAGLALWYRFAGELGGKLGERLSMPVESGDGKFGPAVAVAMSASLGLPVDFLKSRLAPPPAKNYRQAVLYGTIVIGVIVALIGWMAVDRWMMNRNLSELQSKIARDTRQHESNLAAAARLNSVKSKMSEERRFEACIAELNRMFPKDRATPLASLTMRHEVSANPKDTRDIIRVTLVAKSTTIDGCYAFMKNVQENKAHFSDLQLISKPNNATTGEFTWTITCRFYPIEQVQATQPAATRATSSAPATRAGS